MIQRWTKGRPSLNELHETILNDACEMCNLVRHDCYSARTACLKAKQQKVVFRNHMAPASIKPEMSLTTLRRVKHWQTFAKTWWIYDAKWQDPFDSGIVIAKYLRGKHKPIWHPDVDCGDHVVVINASQVALPNEEWRWRHFFHDTQFGGGQNWGSAWERHLKDPTFVIERAIYKHCGQGSARYKAFARLTLTKGDVLPDEIRMKITAQIRQQRPVPRKIDEIPQEELDNFPKLYDFDPPVLGFEQESANKQE